MAAGFLVNGMCLPRSDAVHVWASNVLSQPLAVGTELQTVPSYIDQGLDAQGFLQIWFSVTHTGDVAYTWNRVHLAPCDTATFLPSAAFDPVLGAAFWSFAMAFVLGVWILAKNAGAIMHAIKRF